MPSSAVSTFLGANDFTISDCHVTKDGFTHKPTLPPKPIPLPKSTPKSTRKTKPKSTRKSISQPTSNDFTSYKLGREKVINANLGYAFIMISANSDPKNKKAKIINLNDKKNANSLCQIILGKDEQVTIYTGSRTILQIVTNP